MATVNKTAAKSRVAAKPTLKKTSFNWKTLALVAGVIVVALGFLYYQLSKAATTILTRTWTYESFQLFGEGSITETTNTTTAPRRAWFGSNGGVRIDIPTLDAGTYCWESADVGRGGGDPDITLSIYNQTTTGKTLAGQAVKRKANTAPTGSSCVTVPAASGTTSRQIEYSVVNGATALSRVTFAKTGDTGMIAPLFTGVKKWLAPEVWVKSGANAGALVMQNGTPTLLGQPNDQDQPYISASINSFINGNAQYCATVEATPGSSYDFLVGWGDAFGSVRNNNPLPAGQSTICQPLSKDVAIVSGTRYVLFVLKAPAGGRVALTSIEAKVDTQVTPIVTPTLPSPSPPVVCSTPAAGGTATCQPAPATPTTVSPVPATKK